MPKVKKMVVNKRKVEKEEEVKSSKQVKLISTIKTFQNVKRKSQFKTSAIQYVASAEIDGGICNAFRFVEDQMILVSKQEDGSLIPLASLKFTTTDQGSPSTTIYNRGKDDSKQNFHGLINKPNQDIQFEITNLIGGSLKDDDVHGSLQFNIMENLRKINEINVIRKFETVIVTSNFQKGNAQLILDEEDLVEDKLDKTNKIKLTVKQNDADNKVLPKEQQKKGIFYDLAVLPQEGDKRVCDLFKKEIYWVTADQIPLFYLTEDKKIEQTNVMRGGEFIYDGNSAFQFSCVQENYLPESQMNTFHFSSEDTFGSAHDNELYTENPIVLPDVDEDLDDIAVESPKLNTKKGRSVTMTKNAKSENPVHISKACLQSNTKKSKHVEIVKGFRFLSGSMSKLTNANEELILGSTVGKMKYGAPVNVNSSKCDLIFDHNITSPSCRLQLSVEPKLVFLYLVKDEDWLELATTQLTNIEQGKLNELFKKDDIKIFESEECCICMANPPVIILMPCHHQCFCKSEECDPPLNSDKAHKICPLCRAFISCKISVEPMTIYKFRAECKRDVDEFIKVGKISETDIDIANDDNGLPDVDLELKSYKSIKEIRELMSTIIDGHVMVESLNYADKYTGERWYDYTDDVQI